MQNHIMAYLDRHDVCPSNFICKSVRKSVLAQILTRCYESGIRCSEACSPLSIKCQNKVSSNVRKRFGGLTVWYLMLDRVALRSGWKLITHITTLLSGQSLKVRFRIPPPGVSEGVSRNPGHKVGVARNRLPYVSSCDIVLHRYQEHQQATFCYFIFRELCLRG